MPSVEQLGFEKPDEIDWIWEPGRESGKKNLKNLKKKIWSYDKKRDLAAADETSKLSTSKIWHYIDQRGFLDG